MLLHAQMLFLLLFLVINFIRFDGYFYYFIAALILKENILGLIYLNKNYQKFTLMKYLYSNNQLKEKQTKTDVPPVLTRREEQSPGRYLLTRTLSRAETR